MRTRYSCLPGDGVGISVGERRDGSGAYEEMRIDFMMWLLVYEMRVA